MKDLSLTLCTTLLLLSCETKKTAKPRESNPPTEKNKTTSTTTATSEPTKPASTASAPASIPLDPLMRERVAVVIAGVTERWSLRWNKPPEPYCDLPDDAMTCPCTGFGYGESGSLSLLRERPDTPTETLLLDPFFSDGTTPSTSSILPKQPFDGHDLGLDAAELKELLSKRPLVSLMEVKDYNRDGLAAEFVLQVGAGPCGHQQGVLVGVDAKGGPMRVFGSASNPGRFIVMELSGWFEFLSRDSADLVQVPCGDHGSEEEQVLHVSVKDGAFSVQQEIFDCNEADSTRGKSISKREL